LIFEEKYLNDSILNSKEEAIINQEIRSLYYKIKEYFKDKLEEFDKFMYGNIYNNFEKKLGFIHADLIINKL